MHDASATHWKTVTLGKLAKGFRGVSYRPENLLNGPSDYSVTLLRATNIQQGKLAFTDVQVVPEWLVAPDQILEDGDIAVCMSNGSKALVGKCAPYRRKEEGRHTVGAFCSIFKPIESTESEFIFHLFRSQTYQNNIDLVLAGSAINNLKNSSIESAIFKIPKNKQQRQKIATILTSIDTAIEKTEALIAKYQQIKAGLMHDLFTRGVLPNGQLRPTREQAPELYHETAIGWIPKEWRLSNCVKEFSIDSGITLGPHRRPAKRPHPYLRVANVHRDDLRLNDVAFLEIISNDLERVLKKFDLLVVEGHANRKEIGRCAMVQDDAEGMLFQNHLFRLRPNDMNPDYALLWMNSHHAQQYWERSCSSSSGLNTINRKMLGSMSVCVPQILEQFEILKAASSLKNKIECQVEIRSKLYNQKLGLMQDLLTGKVQVQIRQKKEEPV